MNTTFKKIAAVIAVSLVAVSAVFADFYSTKLNSFSSKINSSGEVTQYDVNLAYYDTGSDSGRNILLMFVPEQYSATLDADKYFSSTDLSAGNYHLSTDTNPNKGYSGWSSLVFNPASYEGALTAQVHLPSGGYNGSKSFTFTNLKLYADSTKGLDSNKSYSVYFIMRTVNDGTQIFRNAQNGGGRLGAVIPIKITLMKTNADTREYETSYVYTHVVEGATVTYNTWPASEIAGDGYIINTKKSSGAGTVKAQSGGTVAASSRKAQDVTIYYDFDEFDVTLNPMGGTIDGKTGNKVIQILYTGTVPTTEAYVPTKRWCKFEGWSTDPAATTVNWTSTSKIKGDTTLYAVYSHVHEWVYDENVNILMANCTDPTCSLYTSPVTLTLATNKADFDIKMLLTNASDKSVTWSSSNPEVATVDEDGFVSAKSKGTTTIKVIANDGSGAYDLANVNVIGTYTVTFKANGGSGGGVYQVPENSVLGSNVKTFPTATKSGSYFAGWYNGSKQASASDVITADTTYTAKWADAHYIKFDNGYTDNYGFVWSGNNSTTLVSIHEGTTLTLVNKDSSLQVEVNDHGTISYLKTCYTGTFPGVKVSHMPPLSGAGYYPIDTYGTLSNVGDTVTTTIRSDAPNTCLWLKKGQPTDWTWDVANV